VCPWARAGQICECERAPEHVVGKELANQDSLDVPGLDSRKVFWLEQASGPLTAQDRKCPAAQPSQVLGHAVGRVAVEHKRCVLKDDRATKRGAKPAVPVLDAGKR
jgi:hypothetical protein